ncbi:MAG: hypothetical protein GX250_08180 [Clostridiales bacterium]|jgi:hypothetical protein|nr:hypothetical protein [Clostridiales bacterium]
MILSRRGISVFNFILAVLILLIGTIGVCYASWNKELNITSCVSTGYLSIDLSFLESQGGADVQKMQDGSYFVSVENAVAGSEVSLLFNVENTGTVPVTYEIDSFSESLANELILSLGSGANLLPGDFRQDTIRLYIPELEDGESTKEYSFSFELNFSQC